MDVKQNKYDEAGFFDNYSQMPRSVGGLPAAGEWPAFRAMLPQLEGKHVLDLGCGFGWHCRYVREHGAASVIGVDLSDNMLSRARAMTDDPQITYVQSAIEDIHFDEGQFDLVISSLALHYVEDVGALFRRLYQSLRPQGMLVCSVEHPIFTALAAQDWHYSPDGEKLHWPVDNYHAEGPREAMFLGHRVVKYHRTVATYMSRLLEAGFTMKTISELEPTAEMLSQNPAWEEERRRPMFFLFSAAK